MIGRSIVVEDGTLLQSVLGPRGKINLAGSAGVVGSGKTTGTSCFKICLERFASGPESQQELHTLQPLFCVIRSVLSRRVA